jgi:lipoate-protein ligase B
MPLVVRHLGRLPYLEALAMQEDLLQRKIDGDVDDCLLLLEHEPVYTLGRGADAGDLLGADQRLGVPSVRVGRGGGVTFHGPGQMVAYPIVTLPRGDVRRYVRQLERILVGVCSAFGVAADSPAGSIGVWTAKGKIASIGIGVRRSIAYHGVALNVTTDLRYFESIVPCRVAATRFTSLQKELDAAPAMEEVEASFVRCFTRTLGVDLAAGEEVHAG